VTIDFEAKYKNKKNFREIIPDDILKEAIIQEKQEKFLKRTTIFFQGDKNSKLYQILEGNIKISKFTMDGKEIIIEILKEGDCFGYVPLVDGDLCECTATALNDVIVNTTSFRDFPEILKNVPEFMNYLLTDSIKRIRRAYAQMESISSSSVYKRISRLLLEMARQEGQYTEKILTFKIRLTHQELGNLAGTSRETVTRVLTQLKNDGYIKVIRSNVSILREDEMETIC
jgi:CRP/FNR family transcriptional regulator, cyclic AMP receptor protein